MPRPSILGSHTYVNAAPGTARPIRASNSRRSSGRGRVVEREHRVVVLDRLEDVGRRSGDPLRGAVRGDQVGEARLELAELAHERVVLRVRDLGPSLGVVEIVVMVNLLAQLGDALRGVRPRHARSIAPALSLADCLAARVR